MTREIHCIKLQKIANGLENVPFQTELGQKIYETNSTCILNNTIPLSGNVGVFFCTIKCEGKIYTQKFILE